MTSSSPVLDPQIAAQTVSDRVRLSLDIIPQVAVVLGSGIKALEDLECLGSISYAEIPGFPEATVAGHAGVLSWGRLGAEGPAIMVARGRFHLYEGHGLSEALSLVELFHALGIENLILTNAAGGLRADWTPGDLMLIADHINLQGFQAGLPTSPSDPMLAATRYRAVETYHDAWRMRLKQAAMEANVPLREGIYVGLLGPSYETMAENHYLLTAGVDAVGMSTVPEASRAASYGLRVIAISCITNISITPRGAAETSHQEVVDVAKAASQNMEALLRAAVLTAPQSAGFVG